MFLVSVSMGGATELINHRQNDNHIIIDSCMAIHYVQSGYSCIGWRAKTTVGLKQQQASYRDFRNVCTMIPN